MIIWIVLAILFIVAMWKLFEKANVPGWHCIIPFLNIYDEFKIAWGNGWLFLLLLIPFVDIIIEIILAFKLAKAFGKGLGFTIGLVLLPSIFKLILGFDSSKYLGAQK
jgi:hypothetical protein